MATDGFPDIPRGSPGEVESAASALRRAGTEVGEGGLSLTGTSQGLGGVSWRGMAADRFTFAAGELSRVCTAAAATLGECASALRDYAGELDRAQTELRALRSQYEEAKAQEAAAQSAAAALSLVSAVDPSDTARLDHELASAQGTAQSAGVHAAQLLQRAVQVRDDFDRAERRASAVLEGQALKRANGMGAPAAPFGGSVGVGPISAGGIGAVGSGFGIPNGGLSPYAGLVPVDDLPNIDGVAAGYYNDVVVGSVEPVDDLTNAALLVTGVGAVGAVADAGKVGLSALGRRLAASGAERAAGSVTDGVAAGDRVFRIYGEDPGALVEGKTLPDGASMREGAHPMGRYWSRDNPAAMSNPRAELGLPNANRGRFLIEGRVREPEGVDVTPGGARPADGQPGGADEIFVPNPQKQIEILRVYGVNPEF